MAHVPHLLTTGPWHTDLIEVNAEQQHHLANVLRREHGSPVSYTDGRGTTGEGMWTGSGIERGEESHAPEPARLLTLAVSPPDSKDRVRWLIEKTTELGVYRIRWLRTRFGQGRLPKPDRAQAWMRNALEQSRRSWLTAVDSEWSEFDDLGEFIAADRAGAAFRPDRSLTVAIGPEGGWAPSELAVTVPLVSLGDSVLRTETAAVGVAAVFGSAFYAGRNQ